MYRHLRNIAVSALLLVSCAAAQALISAPAPSITAGERFKDYFDRTYGWEQMGQVAFSTGVDFLIARPEWGRGVGGFSCGYASAFGARVVTNSAEFGAASALREDIRFRPSQRKGIVPRLKFAAAHAFMAYDGDNKVEPGYARFIGITGGALVEPAWHAGGLTAARFGKNVGFRSLDQVEQSVLTEFSPDLKRLSQRVRNKLLNK
jgi:hypothetical protein